MTQAIENAKTVSAIAGPLIKKLIDLWITPKLEEMRKKHRLDKDMSDFLFGDKFEEYLNRAYEKYYYMNTIVFQNQQKSINSLYIPLRVITSGDNVHNEYLIDEYKNDFVPKYKKVLITDTAGMGKSTIAKWLFLSCINNVKGIPVFIELRKLTREKEVLDEILKEINPLDDILNKDFILKLIKKGDFIFFFDGYDEIPFKDREETTKNLQDFFSKASNNLFVITSRPESALSAFGDFQQFKIQPLIKTEAYELIKKYGNYSSLSLELVEKISKESNASNLHEFLTNPMLVSLLFKAYLHKPTIPNKKQTFYRQVYDALFESHDLTKGGSFIHEKSSKLDIEDFHRVLRTLGFLTYKQGKLEFDKDELLLFIKDSKQNCPGLNFKESDFLRDLISTVPLFNKEGEYYRWSHKSIQEYFVARFIYEDSGDNQEKIIKQMYLSTRNGYYLNVLDLYYDVDYKTFRKVIIFDIVDTFIKFCSSTYQHIDRRETINDFIVERQSATFSDKFAFLVNTVYVGSDPSNEEAHNCFNMYSDKEKPSEDFNNKNSVRLIRSTLNLNFYIFEVIGNKKAIFELLFSKGEKIINRSNKHHFSPKQIELIVPFKHRDILFLDDNNDSFLNSEENFDKVNKALLSQVKYTLNISECLTAYDSIKNDISRSTENNFDME